MREMRREPEVPEEKVPVVECFDGLARINYLKGTCNQFILLEMASSRMLVLQKTRMVAVWEKSARLHIVRLTHSRRNGPNRIMTKALWLY